MGISPGPQRDLTSSSSFNSPFSPTEISIAPRRVPRVPTHATIAYSIIDGRVYGMFAFFGFCLVCSLQFLLLPHELSLKVHLSTRILLRMTLSLLQEKRTKFPSYSLGYLLLRQHLLR